ncbi:hypothetical protein H4O18_07375 [Arenibacter sp. BSSL-BM3]|uniref:TraB/GumN family protein n=1 Tax=Arenibacter arenosicollis TaxID=2762274 RepID=A0ABR7QKU4_9FLAO|nr:hypothetical protein [Arenibacter arenosicollis]MBC8767806.1 hypothetical protein [Arenibacter arenosicollis]
MRNFLLVLLIGYAAMAKAQTLGDCKDLLLEYADFMETDSTQWHLNLKDNTNSTALLYFGAIHSKDASHPQFQEILVAWNSGEYDIALFEGPNRGILSTMEETIVKLGESGYVRYLANEKDILVASLEPSPIAEIEYLSKVFPIDRIKLFFLLREAQRVREAFGMDKEQVVGHIDKLLLKANAISLLEDTITTVPELEKAYIHYWGNDREWWQAPKEWFTPSGNSSETGGIFTNEINKYSSSFRDLHMIELITGLLKEGKKIFAVVGRNHIPIQADVLECEWEKLKSTSQGRN